MDKKKTLTRVIQFLILVLLIIWVQRDFFEPDPPKTREDIYLKATDESIFKPGQVWSYKTRTGEEDSRLTVVKVNAAPKIGVLVSVYVDGLKMKHPQRPDDTVGEIHHMALTESAMKNSVIKMEKTVVLMPDYEDSYKEWVHAFDMGVSGIFITSVAEAVTSVESTLDDKNK